ncbi:MAG: cell division protein FtsZ [Candidatus Hadarchaeia archaeon]
MKSSLRGVIQEARKSQSDSIADETEFQTQKPRIVVTGIGGGGNNTIDRIASEGLTGVEMIAVNTDQNHLKEVNSDKKIPIGGGVTDGRGTGGRPVLGRKAAENSREKFKNLFRGSDLVFLACGLGGGTGTGGAPVLAEIAKSEGALVTGVVTMPFEVEKREKTAQEGLKKLRKHTDTVIVIDNNRLSEMASGLPMRYAFTMADEILSQILKGITETIMTPSLINLDFADIEAIIEDGNIMMVGTGEAKGPKRVEKSVRQALECPLLGDIDYSTAKGVIMHVSGKDVSISEANEVGNIVKDHVNPQAQRILGARIDRSLGDTFQTILLISGASSPHLLGPASDERAQYKGEYSRKADSSVNLNIGYL